MAKTNSKVTSKPSISKASEIKSSLNTTMKKMRKRVTFKGAPNTSGSKSSSTFNVASLRSSIFALDKTCTGIKPYFKKTTKKLFPGLKTPNSSPVQSNRTSPRSRIEEVDERFERSQYLFYPGEWMCDRCGWKAYNKHWCSRLTDDDKILLRQSKTLEQGKDDEGADRVADQLASLAME